MEYLIREFGAWLKQGFGWLVDVIVFGCLWGISQVSRLLGTQMGQPSDSEDYRARSRAPAPFVRVLLGVRSLHRSDTMGAQSDRLCAGNYSVQCCCRIGRVRQRGCGRGCGNLDDRQHQFGLAVSHRATLRIVPVTCFFGLGLR